VFGVKLIIGAIYILYVALKIATAPILSLSESETQVHPDFIDGFILNLLNPKAYAAFVVDFIWLCLGGALRPIFEKPKSARAMRVSFAFLMVIAVTVVIVQ